MRILKSKRSGGPRSLSGKLNASRNSLKTGAYSKSIVLPNESEEDFKKLAAEKNIKPGELQLPMRIMLVGGKFGPAVFEIANKIGKEETIKRIQNVLVQLN